MRRSKAHEYRQAYNAQAVGWFLRAEGTQVILATGLSTNASDAPGFAVTLLAMEKTVGLPKIILADTGFASGPAVQWVAAGGFSVVVPGGHHLTNDWCRQRLFAGRARLVSRNRPSTPLSGKPCLPAPYRRPGSPGPAHDWRRPHARRRSTARPAPAKHVSAAPWGRPPASQAAPNPQAAAVSLRRFS